MLIFKNGYMSWMQSSTDKLVDENGNAIPAEGMNKKVECYIDVVVEDKKGSYDNGQYTQRQYNVTLDQSSVPTTFNPKTITLQHNRKGNIGTFTVQRIEFYDLTGSIEIWV